MEQVDVAYNKKMERRVSTNSESSLEPADVSSSHKTLSTSDANSSLALKTSQDSDNVESDENEDYLNNNTCKNNKNDIETVANVRSSSETRNVSNVHDNNNKDTIVRRDNLRQLMDKMLQKKIMSVTARNHNNNINNHSSDENMNSSHDAPDSDNTTITNSTSTGTTKDDTTKYVCPICDVVSTTQHDFTNHIRNHNNMRDSSDDGSSFTCRICSKVLSSASSLDRHVLVHTGLRPFNCRFCSLTFTTNGNMHRHMRTHKQTQHDRESYESDGSTDSSGSSHGNNRKVNNNFTHKRKSADDEHNIKRKVRAVNHVMSPTHQLQQQQQQQMHPLQKFCCPVCIRNDFTSMINLENHMDKEHPTIPAKCRHCEMVFKSHKALNAHRCGHNKSNTNVQQGFSDISSIIDFSCEKFPLIAQKMCEASIRTPITNQKYECRSCYRAFPCASAVEIHMKECNGTHEYTSNKRRRSRSETSADDEEIKRIGFFENLELKNRSNSRSPSLDKSFSSTSMVIKQELRETPPFYQYFSEGRDFADIDSIIKATSSGGLEKPIPEKDQHLYNREEEEAQDSFTIEFRKMKLRGEFPCRLCTMVFPNLRALKGHNRVHLSAAGPGPYRCNMCTFSINDKQALIRHMRNHNGDRPYECALCNYAFTTKANCERHLRNRHGKSTRDEVKRAIIYHPSEDSSVEDHSKKIAMYTTSQRYQRGDHDDNDMDDDDDLDPSGRSTPVSHLKDMLNSRNEESPSRIQVKSLAELKSQQNFDNDIEEEENDSHHHRPVDLSMDALDLSKKTDSFVHHSNGNDASGEDESDQERNNDDMDHPEIPKFDLAMFEKNFLLQQQLLSETLPKLDPAQMFNLAQMYRTFGFPTPGFPIHPALFLQNPLLLNDTMKNFFQKDMMPPTPPQSNSSQTPTAGSMSGGSLIVNPFVSPDSSPTGPPSQIPRTLEQSPVGNSIPIPPFPPTPQESPKKSSTTPNHQHINLQNHTGPVKMVIKNGVLMPKQKQRRYRTERPFACEHCSARFTLRSNMERHIKQQHPQFWAQRQRGNHGLMRRGPSSGSSQMQMNGPPMMPTLQASGFGGISDQVKYAILAQQLKARDSPKLSPQSFPPLPLPLQTQLTIPDELPVKSGKGSEKNSAPNANHDCDDEPQLVIDEDFHAEDLSKSSDGVNDKNTAARKVADNILEEAMKMGSSHAKNLIKAAQKQERENEEESEKERRSYFINKEEGNDLVSVSKLIDNATNSMVLSNYFSRPEPPMTDHSDEEGLVASGSASESNNSGTDDPNPSSNSKEKKKSAYSLAPNRVSCPYCQRKFPWSSSLRRHILTHTGQKPFKCSQCPLLFTTKSNCDRHLLRKHGNCEDAVSLQLPIDEMPEPVKEPVRSAKELKLEQAENPKEASFNIPSALQLPILTKIENSSSPAQQQAPVMSSDLPFKCHLCDGSFVDRVGCLEHIKSLHSQDFAVLMQKVQLESEENVNGSPDDDDHDKKGKYPDYANRKVICAFCLRRFWSTEDLRRHMRTHSGDRPFSCDVCLRKFTLKHSMLRHRKKHSNAPHINNFQKPENGDANGNGSSINNSASDISDDESSTIATMNNKKLMEMMRHEKTDQEFMTRMLNPINKELFLKFQEKFFNMQQQLSGSVGSNLLGSLLGISDQGVLNNMINASADEAAKMLGVDK